MSSIIRNLLSASIGVAILVIIIVQLWMRKRISNIKNEYKREEDSLRVKLELVGQRMPTSLDNETIDYIIQSMMRNNFTDIKLLGKIEKYERENLIKHASANIVEEKPDFIVARLEQKTVETIAQIYKEVNEGGIIAIVNSPKKDVMAKDIINTAKYSGWRYEHEKVGEGMILIAK